LHVSAARLARQRSIAARAFRAARLAASLAPHSHC